MYDILQYNQNAFKNKIIRMNNPYSHHKRPEMYSRRTLSLVKKDKTESRTIMTAHLGVPGLDRQFLMARKQNYLNTGYNNRRQRLQDITLQNQKIYVKINTQKSAYSRDELRKSYQSNCSISRRLSSSKISNRQSSHSSMRSSKIQKRKITKPKAKQSYFFQPHSLTHIKAKQLENFAKIFKKEAENQKPSQNSLKKQRKKSSISKQTINQNNERQIKFKLPTINTKKSYKKNQYLTNALGLLNNNQGALLHVIAEEMFGKAKLKI